MRFNAACLKTGIFEDAVLHDTVICSQGSVWRHSMKGFIYTLGFFDGVHRGHQMLLQAAVRIASENGALPGAVTFTIHPDTLIYGDPPGMINTYADRERLLTRFGAEKILSLPFDSRMRETDWKSFLDELRQNYDAAGFVCGDDFRFGRSGAGNSSCLRSYCLERGLPCSVVPEQTVDGIRVSSTFIRGLLEQGSMEQAAEFLGHAHEFSGTVEHGQQLGSRLGFPTANIAYPKELAVLRFGVYACIAEADGKRCPAVTNVGVRPTVGGSEVRTESWLLDYSGDLYGKELRLEFYQFLRPEIRFESLNDLRAEVLRNADQTRQLMRLYMK